MASQKQKGPDPLRSGPSKDYFKLAWTLHLAAGGRA